MDNLRTTRALGVRDLHVWIDLAERSDDALVRRDEETRLEGCRPTAAEDGRLRVATDDRNLFQTLLLHPPRVSIWVRTDMISS